MGKIFVANPPQPIVLSPEMIATLACYGFKYNSKGILQGEKRNPLKPRPPRETYLSINSNGEVMRHNLSTDSSSLLHYLKRGFVIDPDDLKAAPFYAEIYEAGVKVGGK